MHPDILLALASMAVGVIIGLLVGYNLGRATSTHPHTH